MSKIHKERGKKKKEICKPKLILRKGDEVNE